MEEKQVIEAAVKQRLLSFLLARNLTKPEEGTPLYAYKFKTEEYERVKSLITKHGKAVFGSMNGKGLGLLYLAEWFRRERDGGTWNWAEPFAPVDLTYTAQNTSTYNRRISYGEITELINIGLRYWRRPPAKSGDTKKYLWAVVREAGFPIASATNDSGARRWIEKSVELMFRGFDAELAANNNSYRFNIPDLRVPLSPIAREICEQVFELKKIIIGDNVAVDDAISYLDEHHGDWLSKFPIDASARQFRALIETVITTDFTDSGLFEATRFLERAGSHWTSRVRVKLSGEAEPSTLPRQLRETLKNAVRARIFLKSETTQSSRPIAVMEKLEQGIEAVWSCRSLLGQDMIDLPICETLELAIQVGNAPLVTFEPLGGGSLESDISAFVQDESHEGRLRFLSNGSVNWTGDKLFLLIPNKQVQQLSLAENSEVHDVGRVDDCHKIRELTGGAALDEDGVKIVWRTGEDRDESAPLIFDALPLQGAKPVVYLGLPKAWTLVQDVKKSVREDELSWRPIGSRRWRNASDETPWGDIEIGLIKNHELRSRTRIRCVSRSACISFAAGQNNRQVEITGIEAGRATAYSNEAEIELAKTEAGYVANLSDIPAGALINFDFRKHDQRLRFYMRDQSVVRGVINAQSGKVTSRLSIGGSTLSRATLWARNPQMLIFEASGRGLKADCMRQVIGETPLAVYREEIRALFSLVDPIFGEIRLNWIGDGGWAAKIERFEVSADHACWELPLDEVRNWLEHTGLETVVVVPVSEPEKADAIPVDEFLGSEAVQTLFESKTGDGPWVAIARGTDNGEMRPQLIPSNSLKTKTLTPFKSILNIPDRQERFAALAAFFRAGSPNEFLNYTDDLFRATEQHQLDLRAFDIFNFLVEHPRQAVFSFLAVSTNAHLARILELEEIASLQWTCTPLAAWAAAADDFKKFIVNRANSLDPQLAEQLAIEKALKRLNEIAMLEPTVKTHVAFAAKRLISSAEHNKREIFKSQDAPIFQRVLEVARQTKKELIEGMIRRRGDGPISPPCLDLLPNDFSAEIEAHYDDSFNDVIRLPGLVGALATGRLSSSSNNIKAVKLGRLYDPEFFEMAAPLAIYLANGKNKERND